jgi:hypothetical protein
MQRSSDAMQYSAVNAMRVEEEEDRQREREGRFERSAHPAGKVRLQAAAADDHVNLRHRGQGHCDRRCVRCDVAVAAVGGVGARGRLFPRAVRQAGQRLELLAHVHCPSVLLQCHQRVQRLGRGKGLGVWLELGLGLEERREGEEKERIG